MTIKSSTLYNLVSTLGILLSSLYVYNITPYRGDLLLYYNRYINASKEILSYELLDVLFIIPSLVGMDFHFIRFIIIFVIASSFFSFIRIYWCSYFSLAISLIFFTFSWSSYASITLSFGIGIAFFFIALKEYMVKGLSFSFYASLFLSIFAHEIFIAYSIIFFWRFLLFKVFFIFGTLAIYFYSDYMIEFMGHDLSHNNMLFIKLYFLIITMYVVYLVSKLARISFHPFHNFLSALFFFLLVYPFIFYNYFYLDRIFLFPIILIITFLLIYLFNFKHLSISRIPYQANS